MYHLYMPQTYREASPEVRARYCNGCGPKGILAGIVPDSVYGVDISEACNIHDWMYMEGHTIDDKNEADRTFLNNMTRLVHNAGGWAVTRWLRRRRVLKYYYAVKHFGGPAFWSGKNK